MNKILFFLMLYMAANQCIAQDRHFQISLTTGVNFSIASFGEIENPDFAGLKQWNDWGMGWTFRPEVYYVLSKRIHLMTGIRFNTYEYIQHQQPNLRFPSDHDGNGGYTPRTFIKSNIRYYSLGIPLGLKYKFGEKLAVKTTFVYYGNSKSKVVSNLEIDGKYSSDTNLGKGEYNPIPGRNISGELGLFYHPHRLFTFDHNKLFFGVTAEYTFLPDKVFFSNSKAEKRTFFILLGINI